MGAPSQAVKDFMVKFKIAKDEIWEVHGSTWVVKHKALERVAGEVGIVWDRPAMIEHDAANKIAVICVFGKLKDRAEWSIGEASPANNKNAYCYAMAEKRGKDRVILKLLDGHGSLYSESEADEFSEQASDRRQNPHVTRAEDILPATKFDQRGQPVDNIPLADATIRPMPKAKSRELFDTLQKEIWALGGEAALMTWGEANKNRVGELPSDWQQMLRGVFSEHLTSIRNEDQRDTVRMTG